MGNLTEALGSRVSRRVVLGGALAFAIAACVVNPQKYLDPYIGQNISTVSNRVGSADTQRSVENLTVYTWTNIYAYPGSSVDTERPASTTGTVDRQATTSNPSQDIRWCILSLASDNNGQIISINFGQWDFLACDPYVRALRQ